MSECKQCERAVRQEGEGAMCFNCYLEKTTPLPTAEEIENDDYSSYQVAKMSLRIAELEKALELSKSIGNGFSTALFKAEAELAAMREGLSVSHIARAVFRALPPPGALPDDWDSGAEIGANNAERVRYTMAASKILALLQERGE